MLADLSPERTAAVLILFVGVESTGSLLTTTNSYQLVVSTSGKFIEPFVFKLAENAFGTMNEV
jgi:hypothetical protein